MIHAAEVDFYGTRLCTCSSDRTCRIFDLKGGSQVLAAELRGHSGPVWGCSWSHPRFGALLASCSYDRKVIVWKETQKNQWTPLYEYKGHSLSVNAVVWQPQEFGLAFACASSDGYVSVVTYDEASGQWNPVKFAAHQVGANTVSWAPFGAAGDAIRGQSNSGTTSGNDSNRRLVSGGGDHLVKIWRFEQGTWTLEKALTGHRDWVRGVAWAPNVGLAKQTIASCGQDCIVQLHTQQGAQPWKSVALEPFGDVCWSVSWSLSGNILAVAVGDGTVSLWKEDLDGSWLKVSAVDEQDTQLPKE